MRELDIAACQSFADLHSATLTNPNLASGKTARCRRVFTNPGCVRMWSTACCHRRRNSFSFPSSTSKGLMSTTFSIPGPHSGGHRIACRLPCHDPALEGFGVDEALRLILRCLTGSARLRGSSAVEDDLLVFRQRRQPGAEARKRDGAVWVDLRVLHLVIVGADQKRLTGLHLAPR